MEELSLAIQNKLKTIFLQVPSLKHADPAFFLRLRFLDCAQSLASGLVTALLREPAAVLWPAPARICTFLL